MPEKPTPSPPPMLCIVLNKDWVYLRLLEKHFVEQLKPEMGVATSRTCVHLELFFLSLLQRTFDKTVTHSRSGCLYRQRLSLQIQDDNLATQHWLYLGETALCCHHLPRYLHMGSAHYLTADMSVINTHYLRKPLFYTSHFLIACRKCTTMIFLNH